jgi:hypothetical protein
VISWQQSTTGEPMADEQDLIKKMVAEEQQAQPSTRLADFIPLISIFSLIALFTLTRQIIGGWSLMGAMNDFMGSFFLIFGLFKIIRWKDFAQAYSTYDIIAQRNILYAYFYPLIEITLGVLYLTRLYPVFTNAATVALMVIGGAGVARQLLKGKPVMCACLGTVFKIPLTTVSLWEDLIMGIMALMMLMMLFK